MSLAGCQINLIDVNFHRQKSLEIFETNSAEIIQFQNYRVGKSALPRANRVKYHDDFPQVIFVWYVLKVLPDREFENNMMHEI